MTPTVTIDARAAIAKFSSAGIPESVRNRLRMVIPDLTKRLGRRVEEKLDTELKSRRRLQVTKEMVENPTKIVGRVQTVATAEPKLLPQWLETGTKAHPIIATNAGALFFYWPKLGRNVMFKSVWHPGFPGINYTQNAFREMEDEIFASMTSAVTAGAREAA